jgi:hypothetical protein
MRVTLSYLLRFRKSNQNVALKITRPVAFLCAVQLDKKTLFEFGFCITIDSTKWLNITNYNIDSALTELKLSVCCYFVCTECPSSSESLLTTKSVDGDWPLMLCRKAWVNRNQYPSIIFRNHFILMFISFFNYHDYCYLCGCKM